MVGGSWFDNSLKMKVFIELTQGTGKNGGKLKKLEAEEWAARPVAQW